MRRGTKQRVHCFRNIDTRPCGAYTFVVMKTNLSEGSILRNLIVFAVPFLISVCLQTLYGLADLFITGLYNGAEATAAVATGSQIMHLITMIFSALLTGSTVLISKATGAKDHRGAAKGIGNTFSVFAVLSVLLIAILFWGESPILKLMSVPTESMTGVRSYLNICILGIPFIIFYNVFAAVFRGLGDSRTPAVFIAVACVFNIAADFLFIGYFGMGAPGAALGTVTSQTISVLVSVLYVLKSKGFGVPFSAADFKPERETVCSIFQTGVPLFLQEFLIQFAFLFLQILANSRGVDTAAAVGIVEKIICVLFLIPSSLCSSVAVIAAQNIGAGLPKRAVLTMKTSILLSTATGTAVALIFQFISKGAVSLFTADSAVILLGSQYLRAYVWDCIFAGVHFSFSGYFNACGRSYLTSIHNVAFALLVRMPGAWLASKYFPETLFPMGLASPAASICSIIFCVTAYRIIQQNRKRNLLHSSC